MWSWWPEELQSKYDHFFLLQVLANTDKLFTVVETKNSSKAILHASQARSKVRGKLYRLNTVRTSSTKRTELTLRILNDTGWSLKIKSPKIWVATHWTSIHIWPKPGFIKSCLSYQGNIWNIEEILWFKFCMNFLLFLISLQIPRASSNDNWIKKFFH